MVALVVSLSLGVVASFGPMGVVFAQDSAPRTVVVRVSVAGSDGTALPGVNVAISRQDVGAILVGRTNASGMHDFRVSIAPGSYAAMARFPGFAPAEAPVNFGRSDTALVILRLQRAQGTPLDPVTIEASRAKYVLDASQITASGRQIRDAFEALRKLRPSMLYDKDRCKGEVVDNVWINGRRVLFMASQTPVLAARPRSTGGVRFTTKGTGGEPPVVDSVLASIQAEHLLEIRLVNCWDTSLPGVGANNALYVALRPGIDWDWKRGSFVADSVAARRR